MSQQQTTSSTTDVSAAYGYTATPTIVAPTNWSTSVPTTVTETPSTAWTTTTTITPATTYTIEPTTGISTLTAIPLPSATGITTTTTKPIETTNFRVADQVLTSTAPIEVKEIETATVFGQTGVVVNREDIVNWTGPISISSYPINEDPNPEIIHRRTDQRIYYTQEVAVRYLRPPTPPPPGDIIIREENPIPIPPAPPLVIRQVPPRPITPSPLVIREAPPKPPPLVGQKIITISGKRLPPPPRKVIIERLPPIPAAPQSVLVERWLAYPHLKRRVIFQRATLPPVMPKPRNLIIQWDAPYVEIRKEFKDLGVIRANPVEYVERYGSLLQQYYELPQFVKDIKAPPGLILAADCPQRFYELVGDLEALSLIDLDLEGLSEYKSIAEQFRQCCLRYLYGTRHLMPNLVDTYNRIKPEILAMIQKDSTGYVTTSEARRILNIFNERLNRTLCAEQTDKFINILDRKHTGFIDYNEFVRSLDYSVF